MGNDITSIHCPSISINTSQPPCISCKHWRWMRQGRRKGHPLVGCCGDQAHTHTYMHTYSEWRHYITLSNIHPFCPHITMSSNTWMIIDTRMNTCSSTHPWGDCGYWVHTLKPGSDEHPKEAWTSITPSIFHPPKCCHIVRLWCMPSNSLNATSNLVVVQTNPN